MRNLETLGLWGCAIDDSAIPTLKKFPSLKRVRVSKGTFSAAGVKELMPIKVGAS
jgi:hypothetical protein